MCERCDEVMLPPTRVQRVTDWLAGRRRDHTWRRGVAVWGPGGATTASWLGGYQRHGFVVGCSWLAGIAVRWFVPEEHRRSRHA